MIFVMSGTLQNIKYTPRFHRTTLSDTRFILTPVLLPFYVAWEAFSCYAQ